MVGEIVKVWGLPIGILAIIFQAGIAWANFAYMRKSMVTKKDLQIAMLSQGVEFNGRYMTKAEMVIQLKLCRARQCPHRDSEECDRREEMEQASRG